MPPNAIILRVWRAISSASAPSELKRFTAQNDIRNIRFTGEEKRKEKQGHSTSNNAYLTGNYLTRQVVNRIVCLLSLCDSIINEWQTANIVQTLVINLFSSSQCFVYLVKGTSEPLENLHILPHMSEPAAGNICWQHLGRMEEFLQGWQRFLSPSWGLPVLSLH